MSRSNHADALSQFGELVRQRRSNLRVDADRDVPREIVESLCELAMWAPNHKRTNPWRFAVFTGDARSRLGAALANALSARGETAERIAKARSKYLRAPVMLVVGSAAHDEPVLHAENRDAVAAGVEHILLGATAVGLASFWSTGEATSVPEVKVLCGFEAADQIVAIIYLGWLGSAGPTPPKHALVIRFIDGMDGDMDGVLDQVIPDVR